MAGDPKGSVVDFLLQDALPLLKRVVDELCDLDPHRRSSVLACWLLERCSAPAELIAALRSWQQSAEGDAPSKASQPTPPSPPMRPRPRGSGESDRQSPRVKVAVLKKAGTQDSEMADSASDACRHSLRHGGRSPGRKITPSTIWKAEQKESSGSEGEPETASATRTNASSDLRHASFIAQPVCAAPVKKRSSMAMANTGAPPRRRFTVSLSSVQLELPPLEEVVDLLKQVPAFAESSREDLERLASVARCNRYECDESLINHGSVCDRLHVVTEGAGKVSVPYPIRMVKRGDCIGEEALQLALSTSENEVSASGGPMTTISISKADFERLDLFKRPMLTSSRERVARQKNQQRAANKERGDEEGVDEDTCLDSGRKIMRDYVQTTVDREMITKAVANNKMLGEVLKLSPQQCCLIADCVHLISIKAGEKLMSKGDSGQALYIVQEGLLDILVGVTPGEICVRYGDSFGELALLYDTPRAANIVAVKDSLLWVLYRDNFKSVARLAYKDRIEEYLRLIAKIPTISQMIDRRNLDLLADALEEITVLEGEDLCAEGDDVGLLYIMYEGECEVLKEGVRQETVMQKGDWIGEQQLTKGVPADVTVRATKEVTALALDSRSFFTVVEASKQFQRRRRGLGKSASNDMQSRPSLFQDDTAPGGGAESPGSNSGTQAQNVTEQDDARKEAWLEKMTEATKKQISQGPVKEVIDVRGSERLGVLGEGSFGSVFLLRSSAEKGGASTLYALKAVSKSFVFKEKMGKSLQNERSVSMLLDSDFIVRLFGTYQDAKYLHFLLEPVLGGELFEVFGEQQLFGKLPHARFYFSCITLGLQHMHTRRVIYRDLKLENCLLNDKGYLKLTDMGIAKMVIGKTYTVCGTADYFAPEVLRQVGHNRAADWWASGVVLFIMVTGRSPFDAPEVMQIYRNIIRGFSKVMFPSSVPSDAIDVIKSLCRKKPEERIPMQKAGIDSLKQMPFFSGFPWGELEELRMEAPYIPPSTDFDRIAAKRLSADVELDFQEIQDWDGSLPEMP